MMRQIPIFVMALMLLSNGHGATTLADEDVQPIRIGVSIRMGFDVCLEDWEPMATRLTQAIPGYDFKIVPLATREDVYRYLEKKQVDFLIVNPAIYLCAEERFGVTALGGMINGFDSTARYTGSLIRRADRDDLATIEDLRSMRLSAAKRWSFSGWIMQWEILQKHHINPLKNLASVQFEGIQPDVIQSVLDGVTDVGAVGTDVLKQQIESGTLDPKSLFVFDPKGKAVPLALGVVASTDSYPYWVFAKAETTDDLLAQEVTEFLWTTSLKSPLARGDLIAWTIPQNYHQVRVCLCDLMGTNFAYATGMAPQRRTSFAVLGEMAVAIIMLLSLTVFLTVAWQRVRKRENRFHEQLQITYSELKEVRASKNLIETILAKVNCGLDIINEKNKIVYVTPALEHRYGPWHGKKCHEYYLGKPEPCEFCWKRLASEQRRLEKPGAETDLVTFREDHHPIGILCKGKELEKLLQVPFYDESGHWLYARVHLPSEFPEAKVDVEKEAVGSHQE